MNEEKINAESVERCEALLASLKQSCRLAGADDASISQQIARYLDKQIEVIERSLERRIEIRDGRAQTLGQGKPFAPWPATSDQ